MPKKRLDVILFELGMVESRSLAQRFVMAGQVRVNGQVELKPSTQFETDADIQIDKGQKYVSRGGDKLEAAFTMFAINVTGKICADVGSSTGGFTDCLLQHGAVKVYAIDVGKGILHWKLRNDPRVVVMEETNARHVEKLPELVDFVTIDVSFISLKIILPVVRRWLIKRKLDTSSYKENTNVGVIALIKPQFEAGRQETARHKGVIRDPIVHARVLENILSTAQDLGYGIEGLVPSPILGPKGNREFLAWMEYGNMKSHKIQQLIEQAIKP